MIRENILKENNKNNEVSDESAIIYLYTIKKIVSDMIKQILSQENIEKYNDMKITNIKPVYTENENDEQIVDHYTYDVEDTNTGDIFIDLLSMSSDVYKIGDIVRVYISNIIYIGFKIKG